jgi:hypothetical protein
MMGVLVSVATSALAGITGCGVGGIAETSGAANDAWVVAFALIRWLAGATVGLATATVWLGMDFSLSIRYLWWRYLGVAWLAALGMRLASSSGTSSEVQLSTAGVLWLTLCTGAWTSGGLAVGTILAQRLFREPGKGDASA